MSNYAIQYQISAKDMLTPALRKALNLIKQIDKMTGRLAKPTKINVDTRLAHQKLKNLQKHAQSVAVKSAGAGVSGGAVRAASAKGGGLSAFQGAGSALGGGVYLAAGLNAALELDQAVTALAKATDLEGEALDKLKNQAAELESKTGQSSSSIITMMADAAKAGIAIENLANNVEDATKIAVAFDMSTDEASKAITTLRNSFFAGQDYETQQKGLLDFAAAISYVADRGESSEAYLANFSARASALNAVLGASKESIIAAGASFEAIGIPAETASRALNSAQMSLVNLAGDKKGLAELGLNPAQFRKDVETDVIGTVFQVIQATEKLGKLGQAEKLGEIFGLGFADELARGGAAFSIYEKNLELANNKTEHAAALEAAYELQNKSLTASINRLKNGFKTLIGTSADKFFTKVSKPLEAVINFAKENPAIVDFATSLAVAGVAAGGLAAALFLVTSPLTLMIGKIALVVFVLQQAWENSETLRGAFEPLGQTISGLTGETNLLALAGFGLNAVFTFIGIGLGTIVTFGDIAITTLIALYEAFQKFKSGDFSGVKQTFDQLGNDVLDKISVYSNNLDKDLKRLAQAKVDLDSINTQVNEARATAGVPQAKTADTANAQKQAAELSNQAAQKQLQAGDNQTKAAQAQTAAAQALTNAANRIDSAASRLSVAGASLGEQGR
ncbi:phage tail tape measure protein [Neisseria sp. Ec49-e6-T10]|uniref:phage tail tape measure protein n=1 Tax=Neisseria sp. Ec49-e6-T10 TaxID=3140744 RepID=UPI003EBF7E84